MDRIFGIILRFASEMNCLDAKLKMKSHPFICSGRHTSPVWLTLLSTLG